MPNTSYLKNLKVTLTNRLMLASVEDSQSVISVKQGLNLR